MANLAYCLEKPFRFPYAGSPPKNRFEYMAEAVIAELGDRRGIRSELDNCDDEVKAEIIQDLSALIAEIISKELPDPEPQWWRDV